MKRLLALLVLLPAVAVAQEEPAPEAAPTELPPPAKAPVEVRTDLRPEYIHGETLLVRFTVANTGSAPASFPDLAKRPWLVRFELVDGGGRKQVWYTTPPEEDPGGGWTIPPRAQRKVLLEIPSSSRLKKGKYSLTVSIQNGEELLLLPKHELTVVEANPVAGDTLLESDGVERNGYHTVWVQKASQGFDLYLHHADGRNPSVTVGDYHLAHLDDSIDPVLSAARSQDRWSRHVVWQSGPQRVDYLRLDGQEMRGQPDHFETPYPKAELFGRPSTDAAGGLHVPLWIPAPKGAGGQLMVVSLEERGEPAYRNVARYDRRPDYLGTTVDSGGNMRLLLQTANNLDVYTITAGTQLPGAGKRIHKADAGQPLRAIFGHLPKTDSRPGGLAVLALVATEVGQAEGRWLSLDGRVLESLAPVNLPSSGHVTQLLTVGTDYAVLIQGETNLVLLPAGAVPLKVPATLLIAHGDALWARSIEKGGPVTSRPIQ